MGSLGGTGGLANRLGLAASATSSTTARDAGTYFSVRDPSTTIREVVPWDLSEGPEGDLARLLIDEAADAGRRVMGAAAGIVFLSIGTIGIGWYRGMRRSSP